MRSDDQGSHFSLALSITIVPNDIAGRQKTIDIFRSRKAL